MNTPLTKAQKAVITALGILGRLLLTGFAAAFAGLAIVAFISIFSGPAIIGLFGTAGYAFAAAACWSVRKDIPVKVK